jgi:chaperone required for assembly of F1-ATPase
MSDTPDDPMRSAQLNMRPVLPKRFYKVVSVLEVMDGLAIALDGKTARTPARMPLVVENRLIAEALAAEWAAVESHIDPALMPLTRLVCTAIDGVARDPAPVAAEVVRFASSDLLCYRAEAPAALVDRQRSSWDPLLAWATERLGYAFVVTEGVGHIAQASDVLEQFGIALPSGALGLAAFHTITTLTGSAIVALALAEGRLDAPSAWAAAHVDEDWNIEYWGQDEEAAKRRAFRLSEMEAAALVLEATRPSAK